MIKKWAMLLVIGLFGHGAFTQGISFDQSASWKEVLEVARKDNKLIFIDFYATWCGPCKMMDNQVYNQVAVGEAVNKDFISVKVQTDKTEKDSELTKAWYPDAEKLVKKHNVGALPTVMFVKPDGTVLNSYIGGSSSAKFLAAAKDAMNPAMLYEKLKADFKANTLEMNRYSLLADKAWSAGEPEFSIAVQKAYKSRYLDKLPEKELLTREPLNYLFSHPDLVNSSDRVFKIAWKDPGKIDSAMRNNAARFVRAIIDREEITSKLWQGDTLLTFTPDWQKIENSIRRKYGQQYVDDLLFSSVFKGNRRYTFYLRTRNWKEQVTMVEQEITQSPLKPNDLEQAWSLNDQAWFIFTECMEKEVLLAALKWSELTISLTGDDNHEVFNFYDTKANLLHKLGRTPEAIVLQKKAIAIAGEKTQGVDLVGTLEKMEKGINTWN